MSVIRSESKNAVRSRAANLDGELVVDTTKPLKFTVTADDVSAGQPLLSRDCPGNHGVCRILKSALPTIDHNDVRMHLSRTYVRMPAATAAEQFGATIPQEEKDNFIWLRFENGTELREQVYSMDKRKKFEPGEYRLSVREPRTPKTLKSEHVAKVARAQRGQRKRSLSGIRKWGANR